MARYDGSADRLAASSTLISKRLALMDVGKGAIKL